MAFKGAPKRNYDAGNDLLDQVPPEMLGAALAAVLLVFFFGVYKFMRKPRD